MSVIRLTVKSTVIGSVDLINYLAFCFLPVLQYMCAFYSYFNMANRSCYNSPNVFLYIYGELCNKKTSKEPYWLCKNKKINKNKNYLLRNLGLTKEKAELFISRLEEKYLL